MKKKKTRRRVSIIRDVIDRFAFRSSFTDNVSLLHAFLVEMLSSSMR